MIMHTHTHGWTARERNAFGRYHRQRHDNQNSK